jgi:hypothetical protein
VISLTADPKDPNKIVLTATVSVFLDRVLVETLSDELIQAIREQAKLDMSKPPIKRLVKKAAAKKLLTILDNPKEEVADGNPS